MNIAMKYCGGCNNTYQRNAGVRTMKELYPEHNYSIGDEKKTYDIWIVICGCDKKCVESDHLVAETGKFVVGSMDDFREVYRFLKDRGDHVRVADDKKKVRLGQKASFSKSFYFEDISKFAALTGNHQKLHTDNAFAKSRGFERVVVHGVLAASLMSTVMGMLLPGDGTLLISQNIRHQKPVYPGDKITAEMTLVSAKAYSECYIAVLEGTCTNQKGEVVAEGSYEQYMDQKYFKVVEA